MKHCLYVVLFSVLTLLAASTVLAAQESRVGDQWTTVRGDLSPGVSYNAFIETATGRLLAAGRGGRLMISDDGGANWRYDFIRIAGEPEPFNGSIDDIIRFGPSGSQLVATSVSLVPSSNSFGLPFEGRTTLLFSSDDGNSWRKEPFPITEAWFSGGILIPGVALGGLHVSPAGELLAYGTTMLSNLAVTWSIGGAVFRRTNSGNWVQAFFELGRLDSMSDANGRLVASGFQTVIDSADGAGWNGYSFDQANMLVSGQPLDPDIRDRLFATEIVYHNNEYVMQAQSHVPIPREDGPRIFTRAIDHAYTFRSANPFDGGRQWVGTEQNRVYAFLLTVGGKLLSLFRGIYQDNGSNWSLVDDTVQLFTRSYGRAGAQSVVAVKSSEEVWRSNDAGTTWTKLLDLDPGPDLRVLLRVGDAIYARGDGSTLWRSIDNGLNWVQIADIAAQTGSSLGTLRSKGNLLIATLGRGDRFALSSDGGFTWQTRTIPAEPGEALRDIVVGSGGRLIAAPKSLSIQDSMFYTSDDDGLNWVPRPAPIGFGERPKIGLAVSDQRIIYLLNEAFSFRPELIVSDDNGVTWRKEDPFQQLDDLDRVFNDPQQRVLELKSLFRSASGRLLILGDDEILTSDDFGNTWSVRVNLNLRNLQGLEGNLHWDLHDIAQVGNRLIVPGSRRAAVFSSVNVFFVLVSDDDGNTWREVIIPTNFNNTFLQNIVAGSNGRVILSGTNAAVLISDGAAPIAPAPAELHVRENETLVIEVPRPPVGGAVAMNYKAIPIDADLNDDFPPTSGILNWADGDNAPKSLTFQPVDDSQPEQNEKLSIDLYLKGGLSVSTTYTVVIDDDDGGGPAGIDVIGNGEIYTSEDGTSDQFRLALLKQPTEDVIVSLTNEDPDEITFSPMELTFTAANWKQAQTVTVTGVDDDIRDQDSIGHIRALVTSADPDYADWQLGVVAVTNVDNEPEGGAGCTGNGSQISSVVYKNGDRINCVDAVSITAGSGSGVTVSNGALVTYKAPAITLGENFSVEAGGQLRVASK